MARVRLCAASDSNCHRTQSIADACAEPMESISDCLGPGPSQKRDAKPKSEIGEQGDIECHLPHWRAPLRIQAQSTLPSWQPWPTTTSAAFFRSSSSIERSTSTWLSRVTRTKSYAKPNPKASTSTGTFEISLLAPSCPAPSMLLRLTLMGRSPRTAADRPAGARQSTKQGFL